MIRTTFCCFLVFGAVLVNTQDNSAGDNGVKIAPKVHRINQLTEPVEVPGSGKDNAMDTLSLECIASGSPMPTIEWSFEGVIFVKGKNPDGVDPETTVRHELKNNRLRIFKVKGTKGRKNYDTGRYRCIATNEVGSVFIEKFINIRVMGKFTAKNTESQDPRRYNPVVGKSFSIDCPEHSYGYGTAYEWGYFSNNQLQSYRRLEAGFPNPRVFSDPRTGKLWWSVVTEDDIRESNNIGGFRCVLVNNGFYQYSRQNLLFQKSGESTHSEVPKMVVHIPKKMVAPVNVYFSMICGATGNPVPKISWQYQGIDIVRKSPGSSRLNFDYFKLNGGHDQELRIYTTTQYSGGNFICFATNKRGKTWSKGQLTIQFPPKWIQPFPDSVDVAVGSYYKLICNATGVPRPKFTWYQNNTGLHNETRKTVSGEDTKIHNGGVLIIHKTEFKDNGIYICVAENDLDILTQSIFINVQDKIAPKVHRINQLTDPIEVPGSGENNAMDTLSLECIASGSPMPTIEWSFEGVIFVKGKNPDGTDPETTVRHELKNNRLRIFKVKGTKGRKNYDTGRYRCIATNEVGSVFIEKFIHIRVMGKFTAKNTESQGPRLYNPVVGKSFSIDCPEHSYGYGTAYEWGYFSNNQLQSYRRLEAGFPNPRVFSDPRTGKLWWSVVTEDDIIESNNIGGFRCVLVNNGFYQYSRQNLLFQKSAESTHSEVPKMVVHIPKKMVAPVNVYFSMICGATGNPVPKISWQYQGIDIVRKSPGSSRLNFDYFKLNGGHDQELRIYTTTQYSGGNFICFATNKRGKTWSKGQLTIQFPPKWIKPFPDSVKVAVGSYYKLICNATGVPRPKFTWYQNNTGLHNETRKMVSGEDTKIHNGGVLIIHKAEFKDNGIYTCVAENDLDILTQSIFINVQGKKNQL